MESSLYKQVTRKMFLLRIKPVTTIIGWGTFLMACIWAYVQNYSLFQGILFIAFVQFLYAIVLIGTLYVVIRIKESRD